MNIVGGLTGGINPAAAVGGSVPEFLYQLTKMLTDTSNREIIEWSSHNGNRGRIEVHHPQRLESQVLGRYFRHTRYSSFQRQLNYFGFRKIAGKGKMSPCSYLNDMATSDICSLLSMRRKNAADKQKQEQQQQQHPPAQGNPIMMLQQQQLGNTSATSTVSTIMIQDDNKKRRFSDFSTSSPSSSTTSSLDGCYTMVSADNSSHQGGGSSKINSNSGNTSSSIASKNDVFNSMAANIAMNIDHSGINGMTTTTSASSGGGGDGGCILGGGAVGNGNKRSKTPRSQQNQQLASMASSSLPPSSDISRRRYTVAIGKGVRHQLNGYLRQCGDNNVPINKCGGVESSNNNFSSDGVALQQQQELQPTGTFCASSSNAANTSSANINRPTAAAAAATTSIHNVPSSSSYLSYLAHPSAKLASSAPAPLRFLDPSELGMSIENSLNQLRDNFALAATTNTSSSLSSGAQSTSSSLEMTNSGIVSSYAVDSDTTHQALLPVASKSGMATTSLTSSSIPSSSSLPSSSLFIKENNNDGSADNMHNHQDAQQQQHEENNYAPTLLPPHRISPTNNYMGRTSMLSRDDSLINLAMLPMLDTIDEVSGGVVTGMDGGSSGRDVLPAAPVINNNTNGEASTSCVGGNDYISRMFSRDNSLFNLLATVGDAAGVGTTLGANSTPSRQQQLLDGDHVDHDGWGGEMFGW